MGAFPLAFRPGDLLGMLIKAYQTLPMLNPNHLEPDTNSEPYGEPLRTGRNPPMPHVPVSWGTPKHRVPVKRAQKSRPSNHDLRADWTDGQTGASEPGSDQLPKAAL